MRRQFLWAKSPGLHYLAPGNIQCSAGDKGTASVWYHPEANFVSSNTAIWELTIDSNNRMLVEWTGNVFGEIRFRIYHNGEAKSVYISQIDSWFTREWWLITATWDFTTPDAGELHLYINEYTETTPVTNANAPVGTPDKFYITPKATDSSRGVCRDNLVVYSGVMTHQQHLARYGTADDLWALRSARRRVPQPDDCEGDILFYADFNGNYDAVIASGDASAYWEVTEEDYDQFALIDDGSRYKGRRQLLPLGKPHQDFRSDDRLPGEAVLERMRWFGVGDHTTIENEQDHTKILISEAPRSNYGEGRGWLWEWLEPEDLAKPFTLRMRVNMPAATNPEKYWTCLGPVLYYNGGMHGGLFSSWGTGQQFTVVDDVGNTASSFKTNLGDTSEDYWVGSELSVVTGNCAPARLKILDYDNTTRVITVDGALADVPDPDSLMLVDFRGRICPYDVNTDEILEKQSMEAWLWEEYEGDTPWIELECQHDVHSNNRVVRYQRGRTALMSFTNQRTNYVAERGMMFGKAGSFGPHEGYYADIRLESIELDGPGGYQLLPAHNSRYGKACVPSDNFMLKDSKTGHSTRIWRCEGIKWHRQSLPKFADPQQAANDLKAPNTWRHECSLSSIVYPRSDLDHVIALALGTDSEGHQSLGYVRGTLDGNRILWTDEIPPDGKSNPFMAREDLHSTARSDSGWGVTENCGGVQVFELEDGSWAMVYRGSEQNPDHYQCRVLQGAPDRWSFSYADHYWPENPICPGIGGIDKLSPEYGGFCLWGNRDTEWCFVYNKYATEPSERFLGYCRGKTILADENIGSNLRPLMGITSQDLKTFKPLPHGNMLSPVSGPQVFTLTPFVNGPDCVCILAQAYTGNVRLWTSEDNIHFSEVTGYFIVGNELPGEPMDITASVTFRLGEYRIYYYRGSNFLNYVYTKFNRETYYDLEDSEVAGYLETPIIEKPAGGWQNLYINCDPKDGQIRVEVVDAADEQVIAGYSADDCNTITDGISSLVSWGGASLGELDKEGLRLVFYINRPGTDDSSPELYAWEIRADEGDNQPSASNLTVDGKANPAGITDPAPKFAWQYSDPDNLPQAAYHILVASCSEKLDNNEGDLWDSGPCLGADTEATYEGASLEELTTYLWKVRVRNSEGAWSEEW